MNIILEEYKRDNANRVYKALEDGIYDAVISDVKIKMSKQGNKMMVLELELQGDKMFNGAHLGGRHENYFVMLNDKYAGVKLHSLLQGVGVDVKPGDNINVEQLITSNVLQNKNVKVKLQKSSYINKNNEIKECNKVMYLIKAEQKPVEQKLNDDDIPF